MHVADAFLHYPDVAIRSIDQCDDLFGFPCEDAFEKQYQRKGAGNCEDVRHKLLRRRDQFAESPVQHGPTP